MIFNKHVSSGFFTAAAAWLTLTSPALASSSHADHSAGVTPDQAFQELQEGNKRFVTGKPSHRKQNSGRRTELTGGQKPHTIVLSCSDSRVPPELVFDQGLGELFTVRVAGNVLGAATVASIEYAVEHLGSSQILVMGHESCGAVKAAISIPKGKSAGSHDLDQLVSSIQPYVETADRKLASAASASEDKTLRKPVMMNVDGVSTRLMERSAIIRKHVEEGKLRVIKGIYSLDSGKVDFWGSEAPR